ncbi:unnamed protein product [Periconia digitata]|uniref:Uncharacterized protein n=1 Tax=Periconia digitata TaxID=1303443 RepID=A0A9W4UU71_9PLEO|nr:unnamed protein product [Periconia digitata]
MRLSMCNQHLITMETRVRGFDTATLRPSVTNNVRTHTQVIRSDCGTMMGMCDPQSHIAVGTTACPHYTVRARIIGTEEPYTLRETASYRDNGAARL